MHILGKIIASLLGAKIFGPVGFFIGLWIGHLFDKSLAQSYSSHVDPRAQAKTQQVFFECIFTVMGHIAKADGQVTQNEINTAEQIMVKLGLTGNKRDQAIAAFNQGKSANFDLYASLQNLLIHSRNSANLLGMFMEIQIVMATADGKAERTERQILYQIGDILNIQPTQIDRLIEMVFAQAAFHHSTGPGASGKPTIEQAYKVLGVSSVASKQEIKKAYRKLMSQHHPDKLVAKGMPPEMIKVATEKSQEIQSAYDMIKKTKGF